MLKIIRKKYQLLLNPEPDCTAPLLTSEDWVVLNAVNSGNIFSKCFSAVLSEELALDNAGILLTAVSVFTPFLTHHDAGTWYLSCS